MYEAPAHLRRRIEELLAARPAAPPRWRAIAAGLAAAAVAGALWVVVRSDRTAVTPPIQEFSALAARTHLRYTQGQLPLEVDSDRPDTVSRWFDGRVPFHLELPDYPVDPGERKPYALAGGRLLSFKGDSAAFVAYRMGSRPISLLVTSATVVQPAGGQVVASGNLRFHVEAVDGLKVITWTDKGLTYGLASALDVDGAESCMVCHGAPHERRKVEPLVRAPVS
jgi:anti-sigma factor RsiW